MSARRKHWVRMIVAHAYRISSSLFQCLAWITPVWPEEANFTMCLYLKCWAVCACIWVLGMSFYDLGMSQTICFHPPRHVSLLTVLSSFLLWLLCLIIFIGDQFDIPLWYWSLCTNAIVFPFLPLLSFGPRFLLCFLSLNNIVIKKLPFLPLHPRHSPALTVSAVTPVPV